MAIIGDALNIEQWTIVVNWNALAAVTWVTIDWKSPEDLINVIGWVVRRRKAETLDWSADEVMLYSNLTDLVALKDWAKFNIELKFTNPDTTDTNNLGQTIIIRDCTVNSHNVNLTDSSTFKLSGTASAWELV